jgi:hypothetical protein
MEACAYLNEIAFTACVILWTIRSASLGALLAVQRL